MGELDYVALTLSVYPRVFVLFCTPCICAILHPVYLCYFV